MAYSDEETRKDWKSLDKNALNDWADEFDVGADEVNDCLDGLGADKDSINSHIYAVLHLGGVKYLKAVREYCDENNIAYENTVLEEGGESEFLNIYTNYLDSSFDNDLSDLICLNPDENNILQALELLEIEVPNEEEDEGEEEEEKDCWTKVAILEVDGVENRDYLNCNTSVFNYDGLTDYCIDTSTTYSKNSEVDELELFVKNVDENFNEDVLNQYMDEISSNTNIKVKEYKSLLPSSNDDALNKLVDNFEKKDTEANQTEESTDSKKLRKNR